MKLSRRGFIGAIASVAAAAKFGLPKVSASRASVPVAEPRQTTRDGTQHVTLTAHEGFRAGDIAEIRKDMAGNYTVACIPCSAPREARIYCVAAEDIAPRTSGRFIVHGPVTVNTRA